MDAPGLEDAQVRDDGSRGRYMREADTYEASLCAETIGDVNDFMDELKQDLTKRASKDDHVNIKVQVESKNLPSFMKGMVGEEQGSPVQPDDVSGADVADELDEDSTNIDFDN